MGKGNTSRGMEAMEGLMGGSSEMISYRLSPAEEQKWINKKRGEMGIRLSEALYNGLTNRISVLNTTAKAVADSIARARRVKSDINRTNIAATGAVDKDFYTDPVVASIGRQNKIRNAETGTHDSEQLIAEENKKLREVMMNLIFTSPVFKAKYLEWKAEYESKKADTSFVAGYPTINDYVFIKGQEFIDKRRNDIIDGRVGDLPNLKDKERMLSVTTAFVKEFYDDLLVYSNLKDDDPTKLRMLDALKRRLNLKNVKDETVLGLLIGIAADVYAAEAAKVNFIAAHKEMVAIVEDAILKNNGVIDDDEWEKRVLAAIQANADEVLDERCSLGDTALSFGGFDNISSEQTFGSAMSVAHYAGVNIVGQVGKNEYVVRFPGSSYQTRMRIERNNSENRGGWSVVALDRFKDPNERSWVKMDIKELRYGFNKMYLDFALDSLRYRRIGSESPNMIVKDLPMMEIATHLLGWDAGKMGSNVVTTPERRDLFRNMMIVLLKEENSKDHGELGSLVARVRKIQIVLKNPDYATKIRGYVKSNVGTVWTIATLLDAVNYPRKTGEPSESIPIRDI